MSPFSLRPIAASVGMLLAMTASAYTNERGIDRRNFDTTAAPCADFFQYANGSWLKSNPVPPDRTVWGLFDELNERSLTIQRELVESAAKGGGASGSAQQKIGDFFASGMDEAGIEKAGFDPLKKDLARVDALKTPQDLAAMLRDYHAQGLGLVFGFFSDNDLKDSTKVIAFVSQDGLGLPERDYYTKTDAESQALRDKYAAHAARTLELIGVAPEAAKQQAQWLLAIETKLAQASLSRIELRDPEKSYHIVSLAEANRATPNFPWDAFFASQGLAEIKSFSLSHPRFFAELSKQLVATPIEHWQAYLRFHMVDSAAPFLSSAFVNQNFEFYGKTLRGAKELRPRWKRVLDQVNGGLGEALGQLYVERTFPPEAKARALELIDNLRAALKERLESLAWMSEATKQKALEKWRSFTPKIGYPDKWRDYAGLTIARGHFLDNIRAANRFDHAYDMAKIGKPVDRGEWHMTPQTVNAYYNASMNEIVFPAAILQPPYFDASADDALNYGAIGGVIGHELLHGFDDHGSQFDAAGNHRSWWTKKDRRKFEERTARLVQQFDGFVAIEDKRVKGELTLGENIADLGGLIMAYGALEKALAKKPQADIDGFSPTQRFYLAWAQVWRRNYTDAELKLRLNTDSHAPAKFRVLGPLSNLPTFAQAFACKPGDAMVSSVDKAVNIW